MLSKKKILEHAICVSVLILMNVIYFFPQIEGKVIPQSDIVSSQQATKYLKDLHEESEDDYLWNPAQFGGMPTLANAPSHNNLIYKSYTVLRLGIREPMGLFIAGSLICYFMFIVLGFSPWISLICTVPTVFATGSLILWEAGHNSKIRTLIFTPLLIAGVLQTFEKKKYLIGFILLALGFSFSFYTRHPQMTYYILLVFLIYALVFIYNTVKSQDWVHFAKGATIVLAALIIGMGTSATRTWSLYTYSKSTMRGDAILKSNTESNQESSSNVDGLAWDYAMQWSNDFKDVIATFIPGFVGGGGGEKVSVKSESFKKYKIKRAPLYWGQLPFTVGPLYLGATAWFLFLLGLFRTKGSVKWWLGIGMVWMILLSMGRHFGGFNRVIFDIFPFYSKFRAPQSVLNVAPYFITLLGAYGLKHYLDFPMTKPKKKTAPPSFLESLKSDNGLLMAFGITGSLALIIALFGTTLFDFSAASDQRYSQQGVDVAAFISDRKSLMSNDAWRSFGLVFSLFTLIAVYNYKKFSKYILIVGVVLIVFTDIIGVGKRYLDNSDFVRKKVTQENFVPRPVDTQILNGEKNRYDYRVQDLTINTNNSSETSVHHNTIGGYSPVKLQRIDDIINIHLSQNNMNVYNMLNTKYFIVSGGNGPEVQRNTGALGAAWFVESVTSVSSPEDEISTLSNFDPKKEAVVLTKEFDGYLSGLSPNPNGTIDIVSYDPNRIIYQSNNNGEGLAVFSEMWYTPGWQAYIDGQKVEHIRTNYILRALKVPAGEHEIVFEFIPSSVVVGEKISLASSLLLIFLVFGAIYQMTKSEAT